MKRPDFIKKSILGIFSGLLIPKVSSSVQKINTSFNISRKNIGFNHMPNKEHKTKNTVIHKANSRNSADFGWLKVNHTFSFANYYNPDRMNFGALRVLNDDTILGGKGFSTHPHDNMEIITIPLEGSLKHKDDMGNGSIIKKGDIQVMSAGKGIQHSEYNGDDILPAKVLQIWLHPNKINVIPRKQQLSIKSLIKPNIFSQILSLGIGIAIGKALPANGYEVHQYRKKEEAQECKFMAPSRVRADGTVGIGRYVCRTIKN